MIFKPKVKQNASKLLARFPLFLFLALVCLVGHPTRAEAADGVLDRDMRKFVTIGDYEITQTSGKNLKTMFNLNTSSIKDSRQYIAYFKIDKKLQAVIHGPHTILTCIRSFGQIIVCRRSRMQRIKMDIFGGIM